MVIDAIDVLQAASHSILDQADTFANPRTAKRWDAAVTEAIQSLRHSPERGFVCGYSHLRIRGLRRIPITGFPYHLLFFRVGRKQKIVRVVDVLDGRRDLSGYPVPKP